MLKIADKIMSSIDIESFSDFVNSYLYQIFLYQELGILKISFIKFLILSMINIRIMIIGNMQLLEISM